MFTQLGRKGKTVRQLKGVHNAWHGQMCCVRCCQFARVAAAVQLASQLARAVKHHACCSKLQGASASDPSPRICCCFEAGPAASSVAVCGCFMCSIAMCCTLFLHTHLQLGCSSSSSMATLPGRLVSGSGCGHLLEQQHLMLLIPSCSAGSVGFEALGFVAAVGMLAGCSRAGFEHLQRWLGCSPQNPQQTQQQQSA